MESSHPELNLCSANPEIIEEQIYQPETREIINSGYFWPGINPNVNDPDDSDDIFGPYKIYVDSVKGSNISGNGSFKAPYASITKALSTFSFGIVKILGGTFSESLNISSSVSLICKSQIKRIKQTKQVRITGSANKITFEGIHFETPNQCVIHESWGGDLDFINCEFSSPVQDYIFIGPNIDSKSSNNFEKCKFNSKSYIKLSDSSDTFVASTIMGSNIMTLISGTPRIGPITGPGIIVGTTIIKISPLTLSKPAKLTIHNSICYNAIIWNFKNCSGLRVNIGHGHIVISINSTTGAGNNPAIIGEIQNYAKLSKAVIDNKANIVSPINPENPILIGSELSLGCVIPKYQLFNTFKVTSPQEIYTLPPVQDNAGFQYHLVNLNSSSFPVKIMPNNLTINPGQTCVLQSDGVKYHIVVYPTSENVNISSSGEIRIGFNIITTDIKVNKKLPPPKLFAGQTITILNNVSSYGNVMIDTDVIYPGQSCVLKSDGNEWKTIVYPFYRDMAEIIIASGGKTQLCVSSPSIQIINGSNDHTIILPEVQTCSLGQKWEIINNSQSSVAVWDSNKTLIEVVESKTNSSFTIIDNSKSDISSWITSYKKPDVVSNPISNFTTTVTSFTPVNLTANSLKIQNFTGDVAQTVNLPRASTITPGFSINVLNNSSRKITFQDADQNSCVYVSPNYCCKAILITQEGKWCYTYSASKQSELEHDSKSFEVIYIKSNTTGQNFPSNTLTPFTALTDVQSDKNSQWDPTTGIFTASSSAAYIFQVNVETNPAGAGTRQIQVWKNSHYEFPIAYESNPSATAPSLLHGTAIIKCDKDDKILIQYLSSGASVSTLGNPATFNMSISKLD